MATGGSAADARLQSRQPRAVRARAVVTVMMRGCVSVELSLRERARRRRCVCDYECGCVMLHCALCGYTGEPKVGLAWHPSAMCYSAHGTAQQAASQRLAARPPARRCAAVAVVNERQSVHQWSVAMF